MSRLRGFGVCGVFSNVKASACVMVLSVFALLGLSPAVHASSLGAAPPLLLSLPAGSTGFVRTIDNRQVLYVVPATLPAGPLPLLLVLDYLGGSPVDMANLANAGAHAAAGEILAFPAENGSTWANGVSGTGSSTVDVAFLADVIGDAVANVGVDPTKVFMTGYSSGGFMADLFACARPDLLAGFGAIAASQIPATDSSCVTGKQLKVVMFHGTSDLIVPYGGNSQFDPQTSVLARWESNNACSGADVLTTLPRVSFDPTTVVLHQAPSCPVLFYEVDSGGHDWPSGNVSLSTILLGNTTKAVDALTASWQYFTAADVDQPALTAPPKAAPTLLAGLLGGLTSLLR